MPICQAPHIYLFICLFASSLFIDGPPGYDGTSPFAHMGEKGTESYKGVRHFHVNEQKMEGGQSSPFLLRFQQLK